jgi:glycine/serine hydroxymethyltransferase
MTSRGLNEDDFAQVAGFIDRAVQITQSINKTASGIISLKSYVL